jgi:acyl-CoA synthetase (AMP-forming)/AMP-acid ligase II
LPGVEAQIRDCDGTVVPPGTPGELWVRGAQVSGEYAELGSQLAAGGWFPTRDRAHLDDEGYLFIEGRADDTVIRGGENIAPAEVEEVLLEHPSIAEAAVFGVPDEKWGERLVAAVVLRADAPEAAMGHVAQEPFREWVRARLRSSRTPDQILFPNRLPYTETGKLLRRELIDLATPTAGSLRCN